MNPLWDYILQTSLTHTRGTRRTAQWGCGITGWDTLEIRWNDLYEKTDPIHSLSPLSSWLL
jgi:hypothetical protein